MKIYIDKDFRCYTVPKEGLFKIETEFFDNKSLTLIEGYRYVPEGQTWTREDGQKFTGEMICPAVPVEPLLIAQAEYEKNMTTFKEKEQKIQNSYLQGVNSI